MNEKEREYWEAKKLQELRDALDPDHDEYRELVAKILEIPEEYLDGALMPEIEWDFKTGNHRLIPPNSEGVDVTEIDRQNVSGIIGVSPSEWNDLGREGQIGRMRAYLDRKDSIEGPQKINTDKSTKQPSLDSLAVGVFLDHPDWTKKQIAEYLGCHKGSLTPKRCPKLASAIRASRTSDLPRGSKDRDGNMEAWEEE